MPDRAGKHRRRLISLRGMLSFVIRENGGLELIMPDADGDDPMPPSHVMLTGLAVGFYKDERLRDVLAKIVEERRMRDRH